MVMNDSEQRLTLKEVQLRLAVPQHVLIHLCEKHVVEPDFTQTSGRGKRREFSERNLFEFALALALRNFELPVTTTGIVIRTLRSFGRAVGKLVPGFALPQSLVAGTVELHLTLYDGKLLVLVAEGMSFKRPLLLAARFAPGSGLLPRVIRLDELPTRFQARLHVDLSEIAKSLAQ